MTGKAGEEITFRRERVQDPTLTLPRSSREGQGEMTLQSCNERVTRRLRRFL